MVRLGDAWPQVWDDVVQEMEHALEEFDFQGEDIMLDWRIHANRRKFDRELFERYGMFKDIILHPKFQMTKLFLEENVDMNLLVGDPIMPITTAVIILFMLNKRVSYNILTLVAAYIFNVNPFYVSVAFIVLMFGSIAAKPKKFQQRKSGKPADATSYVPEKIGDLNVSPDKEYDHVLIGNNISCLYAAALLSKNGHRCCVLQPKDGPRLQVYPEGAPCASPLCNDSIGRVDRYQALLDMAQPAKADRVTFDPIGSEHNGYTSTIISMKRKTKTIGKKVLVAGGKRRMGGFVCLRAGEVSAITNKDIDY